MSQITKFFRVILTTCTFAVCFCIGTNQSAHAGPPQFILEFKSAAKYFYFTIAAEGNFEVDCSGVSGYFNATSGTQIGSITGTLTPTRYYCYAPDGLNGKIVFTGQATGYSSNAVPAISFDGANDSVVGPFPDVNNATYFYEVSGELSGIFPTIADNTPVSNGAIRQPRFYGTFKGATSMYGDISKLFSYISGTPVSYMFAYTFSGCSGLSQNIPNDFFGVSGNVAQSVFEGTFSGCTNLKGTIPDGLFNNLTGGADNAFMRTFFNCGRLYGRLPDNLFSGITSAGARIFFETFKNCTNLGKNAVGGNRTYYIPPTLFSGLIEEMGQSVGQLFMTDVFVNTGLLHKGINSNYTDNDSCPSGYELYAPQPLAANWDEANPSNGYDKISCKDKYSFRLTTKKTTLFRWSMSAASTSGFLIDCGDNGQLYRGSTLLGTGEQTVIRNETQEQEYHCEWGTEDEHTIKFGGVATMYSTTYDIPAIAFGDRSADGLTLTPELVGVVSGSLGDVFPTLGANISQTSSFYQTFYKCTNLDGVPQELFSYIFGGVWKGATGSRPYMFKSTFESCSSLPSIPLGGLFGGTTGAAQSMFEATFKECVKLSGDIPADLFGGASRSGSGINMFKETFKGDENLKSVIPPRLFGNLGNNHAQGMFYSTFEGCRLLYDSIPSTLFSGLSGAAQDMFNSTFSGCTSLIGTIPSGLFAGLNNAAQGMFSHTFYGDSGLSEIGSGLFSTTRGAAQGMFESTFQDCKGLSGNIPSNLFGGANRIGSSPSMFKNTFRNCGQLQGAIPGNLFGNLNGAASEMFFGTFADCMQLGGQIPANLFYGLSGAGNSMFESTFEYSGVGSLPSGLFSGLSGTAQRMFAYTFKKCPALTGPVPEDMFGSLSGGSVSGTTRMFEGLFFGDYQLGKNGGVSRYYIPGNLIRDIPHGADSTMLALAFLDTGFVACCPIGYRKMSVNDAATGATSNLNMANFLNVTGVVDNVSYNNVNYYSSSDDKILCTTGTAPAGEYVLNPSNFTCDSVQSCGKKLKTKMPGQNGAISEYLLLQGNSGYNQNIKIDISGSGTCYVPAKEETNNLGSHGLKVKKDSSNNYRAIDVSEFQ